MPTVGYLSTDKNEHHLKVIAEYLTEHKETLAVAESVTSGYLQAAFSSAPQASHFFQGGITAYNLNQKVRHLGIDSLQAVANNCVSEEIAKEMAKGVVGLFSSNWGIAVTGYATSLPEDGITTLFAFYSIVYRGRAVANNILVCGHGKTGKEAQHYYTEHIIANFARLIQTFSVPPAAFNKRTPDNSSEYYLN